MLVAVAAFSPAFSQFSMGLTGSFVKFFGDFSEIKSPGFGLRGEYATSDKLAVYANFGYFTGSSFYHSVYANAFSSTTNPGQKTVDATSSVSIIALAVGAKYYFVGDFEDDFGLYGIFEAGLMALPYKTEVGDFDRTQYYSYDDGYKETITGFTLGFGVGAEYNIEPVYVFAESKLMLPANNVNGEEVEVNISPSAIFNIGVRYPF